jgi:hypothetical protein
MKVADQKVYRHIIEHGDEMLTVLHTIEIVKHWQKASIRRLDGLLLWQVSRASIFDVLNPDELPFRLQATHDGTSLLLLDDESELPL